MRAELFLSVNDWHCNILWDLFAVEIVILTCYICAKWYHWGNNCCAFWRSQSLNRRLCPRADMIFSNLRGVSLLASTGVCPQRLCTGCAALDLAVVFATVSISSYHQATKLKRGIHCLWYHLGSFYLLFKQATCIPERPAPLLQGDALLTLPNKDSCEIPLYCYWIYGWQILPYLKLCQCK